MLKTFEQEFASIKADIPFSKVYRTFERVRERSDSRPFILYGIGALGNSFLDFCIELGIDVRCVCDRKASGSVRGIDIISPEKLVKEYPDALVLVCSIIYNGEICGMLSEFGFSDEQIIPCPCEFPHFRMRREIEDDLSGYEWAFGFFEDERSRQLVIDKIRLVLCDRAMQRNTDCELYYEDGFISLGEDEVFIDGGAFAGDTAAGFSERMGAARHHVYSFEPDEANYMSAVRRLSGVPNVTVVKKGLWSVETELVFSRNTVNPGVSSFVLSSGAEHVLPVTTLDSYFEGIPAGGWPTFIKLDIEGAEREALLGASGIIRNCKPKLAICAYHKPEDIYELPKTILNIRDDYKFALRQHLPGYLDTVLYAV
jgi:FkbM family methyltransferase